MSREMKLDQKFCINRKSDFSNKMSNLFNKGKTVSFEELWKKAEFRKLMDEEKPNYDLIQFSFVILNNQGNLLFIQRGPAHVITKGTSILQSCSPWMHSPGKPAPSSLDDIRFYFEQEVTDISSDYDIDLLGIVRNVRTCLEKICHLHF